MSWIDASQSPAGDRMGRVATRINQEFATLCELLLEADRAQEWLADGSPTPQQWLVARYGIDPKMGRRLTQILICWWHHIFIHEKRRHVTCDTRGRHVFRRDDWTPYPPRPS
jgi:hypothetical protein